MNTSLFINGEFVEGKKRQRVTNPSTGKVIAEFSLADEKQALAAVRAARNAFDKGPWKDLSLTERKNYLLKISRGILDNAAELAKLETENNGKPIKESTFMDIPSSAKVFEDLANNLEKYLSPETVEISSQIANVKSKLTREPLGVAVLIVPWNYPLLIACWKLAQALAAGNTVVLKPSTWTPLTALELARIVKDTGLPNGVVNVITGSGEEIGKALCASKEVDMISFTGSNEVGKKILEYASNNVKKVTMELGGKSASIVLADSDLEAAVNGSLCSIFLNQGQMCTAMSRIFIEDDIYDRFVDEFVNKAKRIKLGDGMDFETQMGPLVSEQQRKKILTFIDKAKAEGVKILCGGKAPQEAALKNGFFFEPTVFMDVPVKATIFREEVFGPVVCLHKFSTINEAVELANTSDFALAGSIWGKNGSNIDEITAKINAGIIWVNTYGMFFNELPYGGFKQSGFGKELGREGFLEYTRLKNVITDEAKDAKPLVNYWYGF